MLQIATHSLLFFSISMFKREACVHLFFRPFTPHLQGLVVCHCKLCFEDGNYTMFSPYHVIISAFKIFLCPEVVKRVFLMLLTWSYNAKYFLSFYVYIIGGRICLFCIISGVWFSGYIIHIITSCVIVEDGKVVASGRNRTTETRNVRSTTFFFLSYFAPMNSMLVFIIWELLWSPFFCLMVSFGVFL